MCCWTVICFETWGKTNRILQKPEWSQTAVWACPDEGNAIEKERKSERAVQSGPELKLSFWKRKLLNISRINSNVKCDSEKCKRKIRTRKPTWPKSRRKTLKPHRLTFALGTKQTKSWLNEPRFQTVRYCASLIKKSVEIIKASPNIKWHCNSCVYHPTSCLPS